ncbi:hypothetical protein BH09SUM1_BH09SUM1_27470 [soil metagenome]
MRRHTEAREPNLAQAIILSLLSGVLSALWLGLSPHSIAMLPAVALAMFGYQRTPWHQALIVFPASLVAIVFGEVDPLVIMGPCAAGILATGLMLRDRGQRWTPSHALFSAFFLAAFFAASIPFRSIWTLMPEIFWTSFIVVIVWLCVAVVKVIHGLRGVSNDASFAKG